MSDLKPSSKISHLKEISPFSVRGFFSRLLWVKSYILYLLLGNVVVKLYFYKSKTLRPQGAPEKPAGRALKGPQDAPEKGGTEPVNAKVAQVKNLVELIVR
jgi:hypothetical protein